MQFEWDLRLFLALRMYYFWNTWMQRRKMLADVSELKQIKQGWASCRGCLLVDQRGARLEKCFHFYGQSYKNG